VCLCLLRGCVEFRVHSSSQFLVKAGRGRGGGPQNLPTKKRLFYLVYGGTKVITIFLERHKLYEAVSYVYLVRHRQILRAAVKEL